MVSSPAGPMPLRATVTLALVSLLAAPVSGQAMVDSVRRVDSLWAASYASHDTTLALQLFAEDLAITATNGSQKDRAREMEDVRATPGYTVNYFRSREVRVRPLGDAAVVTGLIEWELVTANGTSVTRRRYTAVWARGGVHGWRMVTLHIGQAPR